MQHRATIMRAIVCHQYGAPEAVRLEAVDKPTPGDGEVLIQVRAASLNALDWHLMKGRPALVRMFLGLRRPRMNRPGRDVAGRVETVGRGVTQFKPGDDVFGVCRGSLAEHACVSPSSLVAKPASVSFEQAAAAPIAALTALQGLRDHGRLQTGQRVLINGAAGGVGTFAVQIAKSFGAEVAGVCSARNEELVRSIGADQVFDYTREDFTRSGERYDLILDLVANHSFFAYRRALNPRGTIIVGGAGGTDGREMGRRLVRSMGGVLISGLAAQKLAFFVTRLKQEDLFTIGKLLESGKVTPVIDSRFRLSEASRAIRHLAEGHARGKIVVTMDENGVIGEA
jgi:NADPH:quinone reductase-like Zn-dependent oxidoreductase